MHVKINKLSQQQTIMPVDPVYKEVSLPNEEIELEINQAYGPIGH